MTSDAENQIGVIEVAYYAKWVGQHECPKKMDKNEGTAMSLSHRHIAV
jgi:hypothetical protein